MNKELNRIAEAIDRLANAVTPRQDPHTAMLERYLTKCFPDWEFSVTRSLGGVHSYKFNISFMNTDGEMGFMGHDTADPEAIAKHIESSMHIPAPIIGPGAEAKPADASKLKADLARVCDAVKEASKPPPSSVEPVYVKVHKRSWPEVANEAGETITKSLIDWFSQLKTPEDIARAGEMLQEYIDGSRDAWRQDYLSAETKAGVSEDRKWAEAEPTLIRNQGKVVGLVEGPKEDGLTSPKNICWNGKVVEFTGDDAWCYVSAPASTFLSQTKAGARLIDLVIGDDISARWSLGATGFNTLRLTHKATKKQKGSISSQSVYDLGDLLKHLEQDAKALRAAANPQPTGEE